MNCCPTLWRWQKSSTAGRTVSGRLQLPPRQFVATGRPASSQLAAGELGRLAEAPRNEIRVRGHQSFCRLVASSVSVSVATYRSLTECWPSPVSAWWPRGILQVAEVAPSAHTQTEMDGVLENSADWPMEYDEPLKVQGGGRKIN